jgi:flagellum-specific peptidoglycan hydrolase FlgJ
VVSSLRQPPPDIIAAAKASEKQWRVPAVVSMAQWIVESAWGDKSPGNNCFGLRIRVGKNDPQQIISTTEFINGKKTAVKGAFRTFPTIADCFSAHAELLATAPVYQPAMKMLPSIDDFIDKMAVKYATAPNYAVTLKSLIKSQRLDQL